MEESITKFLRKKSPLAMHQSKCVYYIKNVRWFGDNDHAYVIYVQNIYKTDRTFQLSKKKQRITEAKHNICHFTAIIITDSYHKQSFHNAFRETYAINRAESRSV